MAKPQSIRRQKSILKSLQDSPFILFMERQHMETPTFYLEYGNL